MNAQKLRQDFPILSRQIHGQPLVYLDNAATTQKPRAVIEALKRYYETTNANIHRGVHTLSEEATDQYEDVRAKVAQFINAPEHDPSQILFTRNATEAINLVARAWGGENLKPGDEILLTVMEHHSNLIPWYLIAKEKGARTVFVDIDEQGFLRMEEFKKKLTSRTKIVAVTHASNVLGTINPVAEIGKLAHDAGTLFLVDGAQSVPHLPMDVQKIGADFLAFSAHKMLGPTGVGVLYGRKELLEAMPPFLGGGEMISKVTLGEAAWNEVPWKYEAGTPNIADVIAFGAALDYLQEIGMETVQKHEQELVSYALRVLSALEEIVLYGPAKPEQRTGVVSFNVGTIHPHDISQILDSRGIAIRAGHHCAQPLMRRLNVVATARASFYLYNTPQEIDLLVEALKEARKFFGHVARTRT
ncbi:MAG: cysteine desulfurase [Candidatus Omnitrophica bacterium]|nr:cysteine desulfurase [Candidatus Omnitrophota bacterium]